MSYPNQFSIIISPQARQDLQSILEYTQEQWGSKQRQKYKTLLNNSIRALGETPYMGIEKPELSPQHRILAVESHILVYRVVSDEVQIIRVLHKRMDYISRIDV